MYIVQHLFVKAMYTAIKTYLLRLAVQTLPLNLTVQALLLRSMQIGYKRFSDRCKPSAKSSRHVCSTVRWGSWVTSVQKK